MSNAVWMDSGDPVETAEMLSVERKNVSHPMNNHGGDPTLSTPSRSKSLFWAVLSSIFTNTVMGWEWLWAGVL